jgi:hypothetical protein
MDQRAQFPDRRKFLEGMVMAGVRGGPQHFGGGNVGNLHANGVQANIADLYQGIIAGKCRNESVARSVDSTLTAILGREAAHRGAVLTMQELLQENKRLEVDLRGLKT